MALSPPPPSAPTLPNGPTTNQRSTCTEWSRKAAVLNGLRAPTGHVTWTLFAHQLESTQREAQSTRRNKQVETFVISTGRYATLPQNVAAAAAADVTVVTSHDPLLPLASVNHPPSNYVLIIQNHLQ